MSYAIAPIVEGHGDVSAVPVLLRRIAPDADVRPPVRLPRSRMVVPETLRRYASIARANITDRGLLLLVLDADSDCAATLGPRLLEDLRAGARGGDALVCAVVREFESWIVGGIAEYAVDNPDTAGAPKDRIRERRRAYRETVDQPKLAARIDPDLLASRSPSFRRFRERVLAAVNAQP